MSVDIRIPEMGESIVEATLVQWLKREGQSVAAGEALASLETDKVTLEVSAPQSGVLGKQLHAEGENVAVGELLATLEPAGQAAAVGADEKPASLAALAKESTAVPGNGAPFGTEVRATPLAQRMAQVEGVDLGQVAPSGAAGRVTREDVSGFLARQAGPASISTATAAATVPTPTSGPVITAAAGERREERVRLSRRRQTIAHRLVEAQQTAAMLTTFNEIDMSVVIELRKRRRAAFKERYGVDLGFMSFFVKACVAALQAFPLVNAELDGDEIVFKYYYDIGVAIGAAEGLVVPVVREADRLSFAGIEQAIRALADKSQRGTLGLDELRGGTFTITNGGVYGSLMSTPILNPPQAAILGMHAIKERPVAVEGQIVIRPMMYVALSYDHRLIDGREAVQFLMRIKELVEDPLGLLLG